MDALTEPAHFTSLLAQLPSWWYMQHIPSAVFVFALGAIVGSFLNVVIYRLPAGISIVSPPSRCPTCGARLKWHENMPILGWLRLRGRCRYCGVRISPQYMIIETLMALLFVGLYAAYFMAGPDVPWWGRVGGEWWYYNGVFGSGPAFLAHLFLVAGLVAMTMTDARTFTIPIQIPVTVTLVAFIAWPVQALLPLSRRVGNLWAMPVPDTWMWTLAALLGMVGVFAGIILLKTGRLRYSFHDYQKFVKEGEVFADYPHARREMGREVLFLLPCVIGVAIGLLLGGWIGSSATPPAWLSALGGSMLGYLVGGGVVWVIRILGTLGFGREAMGLGDVHLMGAVGAVLGWVDPLLAFFLAPFFGLIWVIVSKGLGSMFQGLRRELPYGPHLAAATLVVMLARPGVEWGWRMLGMPPLPQPMISRSVTPPLPAPAPAPVRPSG